MVRDKALMVLIGLQLVAAGEGPASPPAPVAAVADFSGGFRQLVALGLPSLEGAVWTGAGEESRNMEDYELRELFTDLKGGGWKLQVDGRPAFIALGGVKPGELTGTEGKGRSGGLLGALFGGGSKKEKSPDLVADANKLIGTLDDAEKSKQFRERLEYSGTSSLGRLLIFATQLHQSGHPPEANRLANTIFTLGASPEAVIDSAINHLATRDLSAVTEEFFSRHDWAAYEKNLKTLTERYPRGWQAFPAVQMLLPAVAKRAAGGVPAKPSIEGVTLKPEALAALDETLKDAQGAPDDEAVTRYAKENGIPLARLSPEMRSRIAEMLSNGDEGRSGGPWLIEEAPGESKDPWSRLKRLGVDALPALAAVANDDTLTLSRNASSGRSSYSHFGRSRESAADQALAAYQSMDRPLTRGELACRLLAAALPGEDHDESGPQALADNAVEFWKAHRGKSNLDLLLVFLSEGNSSQKEIAAISLAAISDDAAHAAFEKYVLESDELTSTINSVTPYLKLRKTAAKDFFARYSTAMKAQLEGVDLDQISGGYQIKQAGGVDKYLKKLSLFVSSESPRKLVLELAKAEKPNSRQINSLAATVEESSPDQFIPLFLEGSVLATHLETRAAFLSTLAGQRYRGYRGRGEKKEDEKETSIPSTQIPHWTTLLGDERPTTSGEKIRQLAAETLEQIHSPANLELIYQLQQLDAPACSELILTRAKDRVAGKPPAPMPDAGKVTAARLDEMQKQLAATKPEAVNALVKTWPLDEQLAFQNWRSNPENAAKIPASVIAARKLLVSPDEGAGGPSSAQQTEIQQSLDLKPGAKIDYELITNLVNTLALAAKKNSGLVASFSRPPLSTGVYFHASRLSDPPGKFSDYIRYGLREIAPALEDANTEAAVSINWYSQHGSTKILWKIQGKTITPPETAILEKLRERLAMLDQADEEPFQLMISVLHRDDLEKVTMPILPGDDEDAESPDE